MNEMMPQWQLVIFKHISVRCAIIKSCNSNPSWNAPGLMVLQWIGDDGNGGFSKSSCIYMDMPKHAIPELGMLK